MDKEIEKRVEQLWNWILHEDNLFIARGNFFLVAESMLFTAFAALVTVKEIDKIILVIFISVGIVTALVWIYLSLVQIYQTMKPIKNKLRELIPDYLRVTTKRSKYPSTNKVLGIFFPIFLILAWLLLLYYIFV